MNEQQIEARLEGVDAECHQRRLPQAITVVLLPWSAVANPRFRLFTVWPG
mgnify:CR=1 FL=1